MVPAGDAYADIGGELDREFATLKSNVETAGPTWFAFAQKAREAGDGNMAWESLQYAAAAGFTGPRLGIESARVKIVWDMPEAAVDELRGVFNQGFTSVGFLTADPLISSLTGRADFDELVEEMSVQAYPCSHQPGFSDFDVWVGDWDVHLANGTQAGTNSITREERGCVLVERWTSVSGGTGMSVNYLDLISNEWVQVWNAEGGSQINVRGGLTDEGMAMEGTIHYVANGTTAPFRALWTPLPDGRVRQYFEQSNDGGETWGPWFEGFYTRKDQ